MIRIFINNEWINAEIYVFTDNTWKKADIYVFNQQWKEGNEN